MDCPVIAVKHCEDGTKGLAVELPVGDFGYEFVPLTPLVANRVMQELVSPQRDGAWARIPIRE